MVMIYPVIIWQMCVRTHLTSQIIQPGYPALFSPLLPCFPLFSVRPFRKWTGALIEDGVLKMSARCEEWEKTKKTHRCSVSDASLAPLTLVCGNAHVLEAPAGLD